MSTEQDFEVLETMMFERPPEWGRRIIRKADGEVMLQTTGDRGATWQDSPIPEAKLVFDLSLPRAVSTRSPYSAIKVVPRVQAMAASGSGEQSRELNPDIEKAIQSDSLLTKTTEETEKGEEIEVITFLGTFAASGLTKGQVWADSNNYLRIVP